MKWLFWVGLGVIAYTYFGYPIWLWIRSCWRPRTAHRGAYEPFVSVVMIVRNEVGVVDSKLRNLLALNYPPQLTEIVVLSDGSTDGTNELLRGYASDPRVRIILIPESRGKAAGLNEAMNVVRGDIVVFTDARQKIEPGAVNLLMENFADPEVGCASGELLLGHPESGEATKGIGLYWRIEKTIRELEAASGSVVGATVAFYAVRRKLLVPLPPETILDDVYIPLQVARQGGRVVFDPRAHAWDRPNQGTGREFARKVRTLTGNYQLLQLAPWLLTKNNPIRYEFVSHKLFRLAVPFALSATLVACLFLTAPIYRAALLLQLAFYALGLLAVLQPRHWALARMADAAFTFVVLNAAAMVAFGNFVTGRKPVWTR
jgi:biofilm PGA synthesis N-glycosyltransferase PgaC